MFSDTLKKFGHPASLVKEYEHWLLLCRPKQVTLGSLILICKEGKTAFSKISAESFDELGDIIKEVEPALKNIFAFDKINYLMLMMHDPEVHFHIIPRYAGDREFGKQIFKDIGWPGAPNLRATDLPEGEAVNVTDQETFQKILSKIKAEF